MNNIEMAASSTNDWWSNTTGVASLTTDYFEPPTLFNTQFNHHMLGGPSSSLGFAPGPNYENHVSGGGNNTAHRQNANISSPCIEAPPNIPFSISCNSIYGQNTHAPELSAIVSANSVASRPDMACDTASSMRPFANAFKHTSTGSPNKNGSRNSGLLSRNKLKARSFGAPKLARKGGIKKTQKKQGSGGMPRLLKALNLLEQLKEVLKADGLCAMPISQLEESIGQTMVRETRASRASLPSHNSDWDIASENHSLPSLSTCGDSTSNSNFSIYSQNDSPTTFLSSDQNTNDLDMRMDMETPRAQPSTLIVYHCTFLLNGERCGFSAKSQVDWIKHEESEKHYPQKRYMCIMCIDLIDDEEGNSLCAFCFAQLLAVGNNKTHYLQCQEAQKGRHVFAAARKDHFRNHLKKHGMLDITDEASTWVFNVESDWPRECGFCASTFETWDERKYHVANHFQQGMDISAWNLPIRKRKRLGDARPGINHRRDDDENDDDDEENDQNNRLSSPLAPSNWLSGQPSNTHQGSSSYTMGGWARWGEAGSFYAERPESSSREKVEAYLSQLPPVADGTSETRINNRYPTEKVHRLVIAFSNGVILSPLGEVTLDFKTFFSQTAELPTLGEGIPRLKDIVSFQRLGDIGKSQIATAFAHKMKQMFNSTESCDLAKQTREHLQPLPLICDECKEEQYCDRKELWARHENKCHGLLRGWTCGIDNCEHMCYGKIGLLQHLLREHRLRELMQKVAVIARKSPSLFDRSRSESNPNSAMAFGQLDVLRQYLTDRYHYAMEKKSLRVQASLTNGILTSTWDQHHLFPFGSSERLHEFLMSTFGPQRCENIPQPFRDLLEATFVLDKLDFCFNRQWRTWIIQRIPPMDLEEIKKGRIFSIIWEGNEGVDANTTLNVTATKCELYHKQVVDTSSGTLHSLLPCLDRPALKETTIPTNTSSVSDHFTPMHPADVTSHIRDGQHLSQSPFYEQRMHYYENVLPIYHQQPQSYASSSISVPSPEGPEREDPNTHTTNNFLPLGAETGPNETQHTRSASYHSDLSYQMRRFLIEQEEQQHPAPYATEHGPSETRFLPQDIFIQSQTRAPAQVKKGKLSCASTSMLSCESIGSEASFFNWNVDPVTGTGAWIDREGNLYEYAGDSYPMVVVGEFIYDDTMN